jgi:hypothetical protein
MRKCGADEHKFRVRRASWRGNREFICRKCGFRCKEGTIDRVLLLQHLAMTPEERLGVADETFAMWGIAK